MTRKLLLVAGAVVVAGAVAVWAVPAAVQRYAEAKVDGTLSRIAWQTTSMVRRGDVSVDVWSWTVNVSSIVISGAGDENRTEIGRMIISNPSEADGQMVAARVVLDDIRVRTPGETITVPRAEARGYSGPVRGLTATPGIGRNSKSQADLFEQVSISRIVAPVVTFASDVTGLRRTIRNLVVNDMRDGVLGSATLDSISLEAPYLPPKQEGQPSSLLITTGAVRYDGLSLPTLWRFRDGDRDIDRQSLLRSVSISNLNASLTMRPSGRLSASIDKIEVSKIDLRPLGFPLFDFDPIETGMRFGSDATPHEVREQLSFAVSLLRAASFDRIRMTNARAQITSGGEPQTSMGVAALEIGPYADARIDSIRFEGSRFEGDGGFRASLGGGRASGFDATGLVAYADRVARDEVLLTTTPTAAEMLKIVPRIKALDAEALDLSDPEGSLKADRARVDVDAPLDAVPQNLMFRLDGLDASPPPDSAAQKWIERMELEGLKGSARFSLTLAPDSNELKLDWLDYSFQGLGAVTASGSLGQVDPVLAASWGAAEFVDKFSAIRLAPFKITLKDDGATGVLLRRAAAKAGQPEEAYREQIAREFEETIPRLLGPPAAQSGVAAAEFIRDPRSAEITLAPRRTDQTLLDLIRAFDLGPVGLAQVVDLQVLYKR